MSIGLLGFTKKLLEHNRVKFLLLINRCVQSNVHFIFIFQTQNAKGTVVAEVAPAAEDAG